MGDGARAGAVTRSVHPDPPTAPTCACRAKGGLRARAPA
eukprot:gene11765-37420_t